MSVVGDGPWLHEGLTIDDIEAGTPCTWFTTLSGDDVIPATVVSFERLGDGWRIVAREERNGSQRAFRDPLEGYWPLPECGAFSLYVGKRLDPDDKDDAALLAELRSFSF